MRKQLPRVLAFALVVMVSSSSVMAQDADEPIDARLLGYPEKHIQPAPGAAGAWAALVGLGLICLGPLFLNPKRTHLD